MEAQFDNSTWRQILKYIVFSPNVFMITTFLNFLDPEELAAVAEVGLAGHRTQKFYRIAVAKMFMSCYLNRVDRSIFFLFYEDPEFQNIEKITINALANNHYEFLQKSCYSFRHIFQELMVQTNFLDKKEELKELVQTLFFEPDVPMPKMKRETIGMYCETPFQQFLSLQRFEQENDGQQYLDDCLQELRQKFQLEVALGVHGEDEHLRWKMETVRFRGWLVDAQHMKDYFIDNFHCHNFLVLLLALSSELVQTYFVFLKNIGDPFMRFIQFNLRSTIFRNIVLSIEDRLAFAIKYYDTIYDHLYNPPPGIPKFCFWRGAFSIWGQKMVGYHSENKKIYDYITGKLRENSLLGYLGSKIQRLPSVYSELRDEAQLNGFSHVLKDQAYLETHGALEIQTFLNENEDVYNVLAKDYLEYSLDMSINEISVHWCGHSLHLAESAPICQQISSGFIEASLNYYTYLKSAIIAAIPKDLQVSTFRQILKEDLHFLSCNIAKPFVLRQLCDLINKMIKDWLVTFSKFQIFTEEAMVQNKVQIDFQEKDNLLAYFAGKADIPENCPANLQFYYNIQKNKQAEIPKQAMEQESDHSEGIHQVYDSENESN